MDWRTELLQPHPEGLLTIYIPPGPSDDNRFGLQQRYQLAVSEARARSHGDHEQFAAAERRTHDLIYAIDQPPLDGRVLIARSTGVLRVVSTRARLPILGRFGPRACLAPLLLAEANAPAGLAVLVDEAQALLFSVGPRTEAHGERFEDEVAGRHSRGGWSQASFARHRDQEVRHHFEHVAAEVTRLRDAEQLDLIAIGGHPAACAALEHVLPPQLSDHLAGHFNAQFHEPVEQIEAIVAPVLAAAKQQRDLDDLRTVVDLSAKGGRGAVGWGPVLQALTESAVHQLFCPVSPELEPASRDAAGYLSAVEVGQPSWITGDPTIEPAELPYDAVHDALLQGARIRAVDAEAAEELNRLGGIAASLRHT